jgi:hypothetical protein
MSLKLLFALLGGAALLGAVLGYVFRWLHVLARKGSIELEVKQILLDARERADAVVAESEATIAEKEEKLARAEDRVFKREEGLDKKQAELEREVEAVKSRIEEVRQIKERAEGSRGLPDFQKKPPKSS